MARYSFFDRAMDLSLPIDLQDQWDLLYGAFKDNAEGAADLQVSCSSVDGGMAGFSVDGSSRLVPYDQVLLHVQDIVQNHLLPSVQSHLLWHGAVWCRDGHAVIILGDSGLGKTTLSLAEQLDGGQVLSDELAAWNPEQGCVDAFPRSLAVRPHSLALLGHGDAYPHLTLDEEKMIVARHGPNLEGVALAGVCVLEWPVDTEIEHHGDGCCEFRVVAPTMRWRDLLIETGRSISIVPHPDGELWWRYQAPDPILVQVLEEIVRNEGGAVTDFHRGARRMPDFTQPPQWSMMERGEAAEVAMAHLVNARSWAAKVGATRLLALVRALTQRVPCAHCVPGEVAATRAAIHSLF